MIDFSGRPSDDTFGFFLLARVNSINRLGDFFSGRCTAWNHLFVQPCVKVFRISREIKHIVPFIQTETLSDDDWNLRVSFVELLVYVALHVFLESFHLFERLADAQTVLIFAFLFVGCFIKTFAIQQFLFVFSWCFHATEFTHQLLTGSQFGFVDERESDAVVQPFYFRQVIAPWVSRNRTV